MEKNLNDGCLKNKMSDSLYNMNFINEKINNYTNQIKSNFDDIIWFLFEKPCGYSFIQPFLKNAPVTSLYLHLDCLWTNTLNHIWDTNKNYISRNSQIKLRNWIAETNMKPISYNHPLVYKVYFDTSNIPVIDNECCSSYNINNNNITNNDRFSNNPTNNKCLDNNECCDNQTKTIN